MKKYIKIMIILLIIMFIVISLINIVVIVKSSKYINKKINYSDYEYVIVLGAKVEGNKPSLMLRDRLDKVVDIYKKNNSIKVIVSGDSVKEDIYNEVGVMEDYLINKGINSDNIIRDNYGISTYDSIVRMKDIVNDKKTIIITQKYHLYRSVYIAIENNLDVSGVSCYDYKYFGQLRREIREILARVKDYLLIKFNVEAKYK